MISSFSLHQSKTDHHQSPLTSVTQTGGMLALRARVGFLFPLDFPLAVNLSAKPLVKHQWKIQLILKESHFWNI
jgi:hypothetical protein